MPNITDSTPSGSAEPDAISIIFRLKRLGLTQAQLAQDLAVSPSTTNNAIHSRATCFLVAFRIAQLLDTSIHDLWPNRYVFKPRASHKQNTDGLEEGDVPQAVE